MRVVLFSWEYPPRIVGKLAEYTSSLSTQLVNNKVETYVVTYHAYSTGMALEANGATTFRVSNPVRTHIGVLTWVLTLNQEVERAAANIYYKAEKQVDLIDVFDWHFVPAAVTLKSALGIPFIYSVDSLEDHRSHGGDAPFNMAIKSIEWLGFYEADRINVKSEWMCNEIIRIHKVPRERITIISPTGETWIKEVLKLYKNVAAGGKAK